MGLVFLNGAAKPLVLVAGTKVRRTPLPQFAGANRTEGRRSITSISNREEYAFGYPRHGIGRTWIPDAGDKENFLWLADSTCLTRHKTGVYLPTLSNTATAPSNPADVTLGACKALCVQGTTIYGYWSAAYDDGAGDTRGRVYEFSYSAGSWNNGVTQIFTSAGDANANTAIVVHAAIAVNATVRLVMFSARDTVNNTWDTFIYRWDGSTWSSEYEITAHSSLTWDENLHGGVLLVDGATVWAAIWLPTSNVIIIVKSTDSGATFTIYSVSPHIGSTGGPTGLAFYPDNSGTDMLMVGSAEGVWAVNPSSWATPSIVPGLDFRNQINSANGKGMVVKQGSLYVPRGDGYGNYVKYTWDGNAAHIAEVGPGSEHGLPTTRQGAITAVAEAGRHVFWAAGGLAASKNASVFAWDPVYDALHHEWQNATANRRIDAIAIANGVLHVAERTGTNATTMRYHDYFLDDPSQLTGTVKHESSGYLTLPDFDGGFAADSASWEDTSVDAKGLTATANATSGKWIAYTYDPDASGTFVNTGLSDSAGTSLTNFLSANKTLYWGSLLGKSAVTMQPKLTLNRGTTNTLTPRLLTTTLGFKKRRKVLYRYEFDVDRVATHKLRGKPVTTVDKEITALLPATQIIKVTLAYGTDEETPTARKVSTNVYVEQASWADDVGDAAHPIPAGAVRVVCVEG